MPNLPARSAVQPSLDKVSSLVRFKGCYLLQAVKSKKSSEGWPIRIAIISEIENPASIEVRLLGDCFYSLDLAIGDYIYLEVAFTYHHKGNYFYLVWYELVTNKQKLVWLEGFQVDSLPISKDYAISQIQEQCEAMADEELKTFSLNVLKLLPPQTSLQSLNRIATSHFRFDQLCVELTMLAYQYDEQIEDVGMLLSHLSNPSPYQLWEKRLLGR